MNVEDLVPHGPRYNQVKKNKKEKHQRRNQPRKLHQRRNQLKKNTKEIN